MATRAGTPARAHEALDASRREPQREVAERLKALACHASMGFTLHRGFESRPYVDDPMRTSIPRST